MENAIVEAWRKITEQSQGLLIDEYYDLMSFVHPDSFFANWNELIKNLPPETEENKNVLKLIRSLADFFVNGMYKLEEYDQQLEQTIDTLVMVSNRRAVSDLRNNT